MVPSRRLPTPLALAVRCWALLLPCGSALAESSGISADSPPAPASPPPAEVAVPAGGVTRPARESSGAQPQAPQPSLQRGESVVLPLAATNVEPGVAEAFAVLFTQAYQATRSGRVVRLEPGAGDGLGLGGVLTATGAGEYFEGHLVQLDSKLVIVMSRFDPSGVARGSHRMTATGVDDLEEIATRMALAFAEETSVEETRSPDTVTSKEGRKPNRVKREELAAIRGGVVVPVAALPLAQMLVGAIDVRYEAKRSFAGFGFGLLLPSPESGDQGSYGGVSGEVMAGYYLNTHETGVYVGGGFLARILSEGANAAPYAMVGVLSDRSASAHFFGDLRLGWNATAVAVTVEEETEFTTVETLRYVRPFEPSLNVGIAW